MKRGDNRFIFTYLSFSERETRDFAKKISKYIPFGSIVVLVGDLGLGKTEFVRGVVENFSNSAEVSSPSYVLENVYFFKDSEGKEKSIHHWDLYRMSEDYDEGEILDLLGDKTKITFIEWGDKISWVEKLADIKIKLTRLEPENKENEGHRKLEIEVNKETIFFNNLYSLLNDNQCFPNFFIEESTSF